MLWFILVFLLVHQCYTTQTRREILISILNSTAYDPKISPSFDEDHPTNISAQLDIQTIYSLDEVALDFSVDVIFRQRWIDERLAYNHSHVRSLEVDQKMMDQIWVPDSFFPKEKRATVHEVTVPNRLLHIFGNGTVFYSMRIEMTLSCDMNLHNYPLDKQKCPITIESYGYTVENIDYHWHHHNPVKVPDISLPQFTMPKEVKTENCATNYAGDFACLKVELRFIRNTGYYIAQIFIPSILIVILSWVSFWVDIDAIPARVSLGVLTVLTMTTQSSGVRMALPRVSYIKAIDVWMAVCMTFVFAALLEFAYVNVVSRRKNRPIRTRSQCELILTKNSHSATPMMPLVKHIDFKRKARHVDKFARILFPASFIVFNVCFWVYYLVINDQNELN